MMVFKLSFLLSSGQREEFPLSSSPVFLRRRLLASGHEDSSHQDHHQQDMNLREEETHLSPTLYTLCSFMQKQAHQIVFLLSSFTSSHVFTLTWMVYPYSPSTVNTCTPFSFVSQSRTVELSKIFPSVLETRAWFEFQTLSPKNISSSHLDCNRPVTPSSCLRKNDSPILTAYKDHTKITAPIFWCRATDTVQEHIPPDGIHAQSHPQTLHQELWGRSKEDIVHHRWHSVNWRPVSFLLLCTQGKLSNLQLCGYVTSVWKKKKQEEK